MKKYTDKIKYILSEEEQMNESFYLSPYVLKIFLSVNPSFSNTFANTFFFFLNKYLQLNN